MLEKYHNKSSKEVRLLRLVVFESKRKLEVFFKQIIQEIVEWLELESKKGGDLEKVQLSEISTLITLQSHVTSLLSMSIYR